MSNYRIHALYAIVLFQVFVLWMNEWMHIEDRERLDVEGYFPTVRKVTLKDQLTCSWQFPEMRGVPKERVGCS